MTCKLLIRCAGALAVVVALTAGQALAFTLPPGSYRASLVDQTNIFSDTGGVVGDNETPEASGASVDFGDEDRSIFSVDGANFGDIQGDAHGVPEVKAGGPPAPIANGVLSGLFYDLDVIGASPALPVTSPLPASSIVNVFYGPGSRYTNAGGVNGTWTDMYTPNGEAAATTAAGAGGIVAVYYDPTIDTDFTLGPANWSEGTGAGTSDGSMSATDTFPTITDGEPWLVMALMPWPVVKSVAFGAPAGTVAYNQFVTDGLGAVSSSKGLAFGNIIGGTSVGSMVWDTNVFGPGLDIRLEFEPDLQSTNGWQSASDDPVQWSVLPEPTTLSLMGLGLASLVGARIKRRRH